MEEACVLYIRERVRIYSYVFKISNLQRKTATDTNDHEIDRTLSISLALQKIQIKIISWYCHIDRVKAWYLMLLGLWTKIQIQSDPLLL